jgi:hypothetical protein
METRLHEKGNFCSKKEISVRKRKFLLRMASVRARVSIAQFSPSPSSFSLRNTPMDRPFHTLSHGIHE